MTDELDLGEKREAIEAAAVGGAQFFVFRDYIADIEKDVRVNLEMPFSRVVIDELRKIITVFVEHVAEDLKAAPGTVKSPVTAPGKLKKLQETGEGILVGLGPYAEIADLYFNETAKKRRLNRPLNESALEIDTIVGRAIALRETIVEYLNGLLEAIRHAYPDGDPG